MTKMGARVIVAPDDTAAVEIDSPRLPLPTLTPAPEGTPVADQRKPELVSVALGGQGSEGVDVTKSGPHVLNPFERARVAKIQTAADALAKGKAAKAAVELSAAKAAAANKAIVGLRSAELAVAAARSKLDAATKALDVVKTPEAAERAKAVVAAAEASPRRCDQGRGGGARGRSHRDARSTRRRARGLGRRERQQDRDCRRQGCRARARTRSPSSSARRPAASTSARPGLRSMRRR